MSAAGSDRKIGSALSERDELASELADLQAIERSLETFGYSTASIGATEPSAATNEELNDVHLTAAKKAFADYDLNKNGCIEVNELAYLTAEMGYPLEGKGMSVRSLALVSAPVFDADRLIDRSLSLYSYHIVQM